MSFFSLIFNYFCLKQLHTIGKENNNNIVRSINNSYMRARNYIQMREFYIFKIPIEFLIIFKL
jgi:hypothetical protein